MRILLAVDESASSQAAVKEVESRSWPEGTIVRVLSVLDKFVPPAATLWYDAGGDAAEARDEVKENRSEGLEPIVARLSAAGLQAESFVRDGNPSEIILKEAKSWPADLIVIGSHSHSAITDLLHGDTTAKVVKHAPCPVEVVPPPSSSN